MGADRVIKTCAPLCGGDGGSCRAAAERLAMGVTGSQRTAGGRAFPEQGAR